MKLSDLSAHWVNNNGRVTVDVVDFFGICGYELGVRDLQAVVEQTQAWMKARRPDGNERWHMTPLEISDTERFMELAGKLGLAEPTPKIDAAGKTLVILGSTFKSMRHRSAQALTLAPGAEQVIFLTSARDLNKEEVEMIGEYIPGYTGGTEYNAANVIRDHVVEFPLRVRVENLETPDREDGKRARTDETVEMLVGWLDKHHLALSDMIFVTHAPSTRQCLTVQRKLDELVPNSASPPSYLVAPPLTPLKEQGERVFDEACRFLFELGNLQVEAPS